MAAKHGHTRIAKLLLAHNAEPNVEGRSGLTPLHIATHFNRPEVATLLLQNGACPQRVAKNGYTSLHIAARKNRQEVAQTLLDHSANPNSESKNGYTPLHLAAQSGLVDMVTLLCERGSTVNHSSRDGLTALHLSAQEDRVGVARVLLQQFNAQIDPKTKAGYTPLHTACHFGQTNMIRFLLEAQADINSRTKMGYTPLHQAAQQGQLAVINILIKNGASPDLLTENGLSAMDIAQRLGYISVVELLKRITSVQSPEPLVLGVGEERYRPVIPETMQDGVMSDSDDEAGDEGLAGGEHSAHYITSDELRVLQDDSVSLIRDDRDLSYEGRMTERMSMSSSMFQTVAATEGVVRDDTDSSLVHQRVTQSTQAQIEATPRMFSSMPGTHSPIKPSLSEADCHIYAPPGGGYRGSGGYRGAGFSSVSADNITIARPSRYTPGMMRWRSFLVSFVIDARGGALQGARHSGVRVIIPPGKVCQPTRITCRLMRGDKLTNPPPLMEGEALAGRVIEVGPVGCQFTGPVILEVPHQASLRERVREVLILRSDDGLTWREHQLAATDEAVQDTLSGSFQELESCEDLEDRRMVRIMTTDLPQYFALMTRCRQETVSVGGEGSIISSTVVPQVQAVFPPGALLKTIKVGLQVQPVTPDLVTRLLGNRVAVSPIVTVEPRRRKFHKPIKITLPLPKAAQKGMMNQCSPESSATLHLLCSIAGGTMLSQWEDVTGTTPLSFSSANDCVTFTTSVSARFWLMDCQTLNEAAKMAADLYQEVVCVPFMSRFIVYAKRHSVDEARLRIFCSSDERGEGSLENKERYTEVARSKDIELLDGRRCLLEFAGNLIPITKSGDQPSLTFRAFRDSRLPLTVRVKDSSEEPIGRVTFITEPIKVSRHDTTQVICNLNINLSSTVIRPRSAMEDSGSSGYSIVRPHDYSTSKSDMRLSDVAEAIQNDWINLASQLSVSEAQVSQITSDHPGPTERCLAMLRLWTGRASVVTADRGTCRELERALVRIGREDVAKNFLLGGGGGSRPSSRLYLSGDYTRKDSLMSSSLESSYRGGSSMEASYEERELLRSTDPTLEHSWSETTSYDSKEIETEQEHTTMEGDTVLTPVLEEEDRSGAEELILCRAHVDREEGMDDSVYDDDNTPTGLPTPVNASASTKTLRQITPQLDLNQNSPLSPADKLLTTAGAVIGPASNQQITAGSVIGLAGSQLTTAGQAVGRAGAAVDQNENVSEERLLCSVTNTTLLAAVPSLQQEQYQDTQDIQDTRPESSQDSQDSTEISDAPTTPDLPTGPLQSVHSTAELIQLKAEDLEITTSPNHKPHNNDNRVEEQIQDDSSTIT